MAHLDHDLTGWKLEGAHRVVACDRCHAGGRFVGTDRWCGSCHASAQPHNTAPGRRDLLSCDRCHTSATWSPPRARMQFDHNDRKDAAFALDPGQRLQPCAACHPNARFKP